MSASYAQPWTELWHHQGIGNLVEAMGWSIKRCTDAEMEVPFRIWADVWRRGEPYDEDKKTLQAGEKAFIAYEDSIPCGAWLEYDASLSRGGATVPSIGVAAVAVPGEFRHSGVGNFMMQSALNAMSERGVGIATLYAFRESYYRKFGYEVCGLRYKITCPRESLPKLNPDLHVRRISDNDIGQLDPCYRQFAQQHSGMWIRSAADWKRRMGQRTPMIYAAGDPIEAYAWTAMEGGFWEDLRIGEFVWSSRRGYLSILATLSGLCINRSALVWNEPTRSPFLAEFMQESSPFLSERLVMYRAVNVKHCLESLNPTASGSFRVRIHDDLIKQNDQTIEVQFGDGRVTANPTQSSEDFSMDIRQFVQAFLGEPSLADLEKLGLINVRSIESLNIATRLLTPECVACYDYF